MTPWGRLVMDAALGSWRSWVRIPPPPLLGPNWDQSAQTCCEADFGSRIKILGHPLGQSASFFEIYPFRLGSLWGHVGVRNKSRAPQGSPRIQTGLPPHPNISKWLSSHFEFRRPWGGDVFHDARLLPSRLPAQAVSGRRTVAWPGYGSLARLLSFSRLPGYPLDLGPPRT